MCALIVIGTFKLATQWLSLLPGHWATVWGKPSWANHRGVNRCMSCLQVSLMWQALHRPGLPLSALLQGRWLSSKKKAKLSKAMPGVTLIGFDLGPSKSMF